ncbi:DEDD exonuclease domain-containing protein [Solicola sp. PLA-1-18]|uniref:DEDD exonuclease domain-containing protein n=1 Tax=Solicola sp. PLA-1-18 TaxID=3380532 RepID=UPI003B7F76F9
MEQTTAVRPVQAVRGVQGVQASFDELGRPLRDVTFCIVDLETTGGSAAKGSMITEIGAVKVRGGEVLGEFQTLVNPQSQIPAFIAVLTGITDAMVAGAPRITSALPAFLEFARGCVVVAHNAPFDVGFLKHFCAQTGQPWPGFETLDTAVLARRVLHAGEVRNCKLGTLAAHFRATTTPTHRALDDARATVDVLHGLLERLGPVGVHTLEELGTFSSRVSPAQRRKRHLGDHLPDAPGVYVFRDARDRPLYIGTSKSLRTRVRGYFTSSETRTRMGEMVGLAVRVEGIVCATPLEAQVRELRLIGLHKPPYNRRSRFPEKVSWVKITREPWPRLSIVREVAGDGADYLGPFGRRRAAESAVAALHEAFSIRQCAGRLPKAASRAACVLAEMRACLSPCDGSASIDDYAREVERVRASVLADPSAVVEAVESKMADLSAQERFEDAGAHRDRLAAFLGAAARTQRLSALTTRAEVVAARIGDTGSWEVHVVRHGRLAASGTIPGGVDVRAWVDDLRAGAETVEHGPGPAPAASAAESELILRWLELDGLRLVEIDGPWICPVGGASRFLPRFESAAESRSALVPFDEQQRSGGWRTEHRPTRAGATA